MFLFTCVSLVFINDSQSCLIKKIRGIALAVETPVSCFLAGRQLSGLIGRVEGVEGGLLLAVPLHCLQDGRKTAVENTLLLIVYIARYQRKKKGMLTT